MSRVVAVNPGVWNLFPPMPDGYSDGHYYVRGRLGIHGETVWKGPFDTLDTARIYAVKMIEEWGFTFGGKMRSITGLVEIGTRAWQVRQRHWLLYPEDSTTEAQYRQGVYWNTGKTAGTTVAPAQVQLGTTFGGYFPEDYGNKSAPPITSVQWGMITTESENPSSDNRITKGINLGNQLDPAGPLLRDNSVGQFYSRNGQIVQTVCRGQTRTGNQKDYPADNARIDLARARWIDTVPSYLPLLDCPTILGPIAAQDYMDYAAWNGTELGHNANLSLLVPTFAGISPNIMVYVPRPNSFNAKGDYVGANDGKYIPYDDGVSDGYFLAGFEAKVTDYLMKVWAYNTGQQPHPATDFTPTTQAVYSFRPEGSLSDIKLTPNGGGYFAFDTLETVPFATVQPSSYDPKGAPSSFTCIETGQTVTITDLPPPIPANLPGNFTGVRCAFNVRLSFDLTAVYITRSGGTETITRAAPFPTTVAYFPMRQEPPFQNMISTVDIAANPVNNPTVSGERIWQGGFEPDARGNLQPVGGWGAVETSGPGRITSGRYQVYGNFALYQLGQSHHDCIKGSMSLKFGQIPNTNGYAIWQQWIGSVPAVGGASVNIWLNKRGFWACNFFITDPGQSSFVNVAYTTGSNATGYTFPTFGQTVNATTEAAADPNNCRDLSFGVGPCGGVAHYQVYPIIEKFQMGSTVPYDYPLTTTETRIVLGNIPISGTYIQDGEIPVIDDRTPATIFNDTQHISIERSDGILTYNQLATPITTENYSPGWFPSLVAGPPPGIVASARYFTGTITLWVVMPDDKQGVPVKDNYYDYDGVLGSSQFRILFDNGMIAYLGIGTQRQNYDRLEPINSSAKFLYSFNKTAPGKAIVGYGLETLTVEPPLFLGDSSHDLFTYSSPYYATGPMKFYLNSDNSSTTIPGPDGSITPNPNDNIIIGTTYGPEIGKLATIRRQTANGEIGLTIYDRPQKKVKL